MGVIVNKYESLIRLIITSVVMIAIPFALMGIIFGAMCLTHSETMTGITYTAYGVGFLLGSLTHFISIICGLFKSCFLTFVENIKTFFSDMSISVKMAFKYLFYNIDADDFEFPTYVLIIIGTLVVGIIFLIKDIQYYFG